VVAPSLVAVDPAELFAAEWRGDLPVAGNAGRWWVRGADLLSWRGNDGDAEGERRR
jgi:hypothetical protein